MATKPTHRRKPRHAARFVGVEQFGQGQASPPASLGFPLSGVSPTSSARVML
jgi:hypothetical protein